jgi:serine/threonine protein kinase
MGVCVRTLVTVPHPRLPNPKSNILINNSGRACLAGFSQLTIASEESTFTSLVSECRDHPRVQWMSPELIPPEWFTSPKPLSTSMASDCYALGIVIYEVLSRRRLFFGPGRPAIIASMIRDGKRPGRPRGKDGELFTDSIWEILKLCWKHQPHDRISAKAVLLGLEGNPSTSRPSSTADGVVETDKDNESSTGMFSPFLPKLVVSHPCAVIGPPIAHGDTGLPARSQTNNPKEGRTGDGLLWSAWEAFGAATRMLYGDVDKPDVTQAHALP